MSKSFRNVLVLIIVFVVIGIVLVLVPFKTKQEQTGAEGEQATPDVADTVEESIPDTSPTANTNPFSGAYNNPFK